jgi:GTP cyclohydrolase II
VRRVAEAQLPTAFGLFRIISYEGSGVLEHAALVKGDVAGDDAVTVRIHSKCMTGDAFASLRCDCGPQLQLALAIIEAAGSGVVLYLDQEGRGIGLGNKIRAYALQECGLDTVDANVALGLAIDDRDFGVAAAMLDDLGVRRVRLLTNNPAKVARLSECGIDVTERVSVLGPVNPHNQQYLATKAARLGHVFD